MSKLSLELAVKALKRLGLTEMDAQVYVYLAKKGPREEKELVNALKLTKRQLFFSLENLVDKGMVSSSPERSVKYSAIALEKVLDQYLKTRKEQVKALKASKDEFLSAWRSMIKDDHGNS
jgi:sugar-specific transcriptional regulator TrmB